MKIYRAQHSPSVLPSQVEGQERQAAGGVPGWVGFSRVSTLLSCPMIGECYLGDLMMGINKLSSGDRTFIIYNIQLNSIAYVIFIHLKNKLSKCTSRLFLLTAVFTVIVSKYHPTFINGIKPGGISQVINRLKEMLINEICALRTENEWQTPSLAL